MTDRMPVLFIGHGSPMNAIQDNEFSRAWEAAGRALPAPRAVVCISAHWETVGTRVTAMDRPATLYDFHGFPHPLYETKYPAPGDPGLAESIRNRLDDVGIHLDYNWGLDHGAWSVCSRMYPEADIPVLQLSIDFDRPPPFHYALGRRLKYLRNQGILVVGSGNMVHNLRSMAWEDTAFDWAVDADRKLADLIVSGDHDRLIAYETLGDDVQRGIPTNEHFLPLLYVAAMQEPGDAIRFFCEKVTLGSISMRCLRIG